MKILLTGASGYVGSQLLPILVADGHQVICAVRSPSGFFLPKEYTNKVQVVEVDFLNPDSLDRIPIDIDGAYYLIHSLDQSPNFRQIDLKAAKNFRECISKTKARHVIYLGGIVNNSYRSKHLRSRLEVENELQKGDYHFTSLRSGIIIGSGGSSFQIIKELMHKLPVIFAPLWLNRRSQPIAIQDVIRFLSQSLFKKETYGKDFDIGGSDLLSYKEILERYARVAGLQRRIFIGPFMPTQLSALWVSAITSQPSSLVEALAESMKYEAIPRNQDLNAILRINPISIEEAFRKTLESRHKVEL